MVDMHGAAGFVGDGFRHEGGVAIVAQGGFADQTFEIEHLVGQPHGVTVDQVDLKLARAAFLGDTVNLKPLRLGKVVDVVDHGAEFIDGGHGIGLTCGSRAAGAAHHRFDLMRGVEVARDQKEFHLGGDNRLPALRAIKIDNAFEHIARRIFHRIAVAVKGVVDHLQCPVAGPGGGGRGRDIGPQDHVFFDEPVGTGGVAPFTGDGLVEDAVGQVKIFLPCEFCGGHRFAASNAGEVGDDTFNFVEPLALQIFACCGGKLFKPVGHHNLSFLRKSAIWSAIFALSVGASSRAEAA